MSEQTKQKIANYALLLKRMMITSWQKAVINKLACSLKTS